MQRMPFGNRKKLLPLVALSFFLACGSVTAAKPIDAFENSPIAKLAAQLAPGEFGPLVSTLPKGVARYADLLSGFRPDGSTAPPIDTWTDSAQWDPQRKRAFFQGLRQSNRFLTYHAIGNAWEEISLKQENAPPLFERFGHLYGRTALDARRGHFYRLVGNTLHRYVIDERRWERFDDAPVGGYIPIGWHEGLDLLVALEKGTLHGFRDGRWSLRGKASVDGRHSSAKYNPKRRDMLFIGGNRSRESVDLLTAAGEVRHMRDAPFPYSIRSDRLTHDPQSGNYLVLHDRILWEYSPDLDEWRVARDMSAPNAEWPFGRGGIVPIPIDELGVILWSVESGPMLYRHRSVFTKVESTPKSLRSIAR